MKNSASETTTQDPNEGYSADENLSSTNGVVDTRIGLKTITATAIGAHPERAKTLERIVPCCRITGIVSGVMEVPADPTKPDGDTLYVLVGEFVANTYGVDGNTYGYKGEWCALPVGQTIMLQRFQHACDMSEPEATPQLEFDIEFAAQPAKNPSGYRWLHKNMMLVPADSTHFLSDQRMQDRRQTVMQLGGGNGFDPVAIEHKPL